ncbi:MarR family winged helix-turn-helix transcriptional regulator [Paraglaciecola hydrolytica]|uniref:MarR family transcriptional regulator n=1 Tax=Paraglaciecola hydrolytica TaxID=1799789 RepID=A0A148KKC6_9ALTE|nr:MarR family transcriptional regulator [Paraglaciecola hydrolytica]KXI26730.1 MarR family transcriptional regulator [Paraglaciecola hydrolytica]
MQAYKDDSAKRQLDLEKYIPALVTSLSNKLSAGASNCYRKYFNIGVIEWRVLAMLKVESDISANRICQVIGLDKAAVSRALKQLQASGLVSFIKDKLDGRSSSIHLTHQGEILHDKILTVALAREKLLLEGISEAELEVLIEVLLKLNKNLQQVNAFEPIIGF